MESNYSDTYGILPQSAPLAVPYVPYQQENPSKYEKMDALSNGTLFPGLNLPFCAKIDGGKLTDNAMTELQALEFVVLELGLYLDTHPNDSEAFDLYKKYVAMNKSVLESYVSDHGPVYKKETAYFDHYNWLTQDWPWNCETGGSK